MLQAVASKRASTISCRARRDALRHRQADALGRLLVVVEVVDYH